MRAVGRNAPRREGPEKLCGTARYIDDYHLPGCLYGVTVRSTVAHGTLRGLEFDPRFPWHECVVATAGDIPGENTVLLIEHDQPLLASSRIRHPMEPLALIAHPKRERAWAALRHVSVAVDPLEPVLSIDESLAATVRAPRRRQRLQADSRRARRRRVCPRGGRDHRRRRVSRPASGAGVHREQRRGGVGRRRWDHRRHGLDAVPVLRAQGAQAPLRAARPPRPRHPDDHRRRLRRQGGVSEHDRRARGAARAQVAPSGEDDLRPPRRHGGHDQATPGTHPPSHGRVARRSAAWRRTSTS